MEMASNCWKGKYFFVFTTLFAKYSINPSVGEQNEQNDECETMFSMA